ncbi:phosphatidylserine decarboxylase-domain-containing protein [Pholiota molesta]|nr:phosphatidylserine decarboxylase-domain-containing protein [Pholiota molesta]
MPAWVHHLIPGIEKLAVEYHCGTTSSSEARTTTRMHLLFYGKEQTKILETRRVEALLREESIKVHSSCQPDITKYGNFNEFFYRYLRFIIREAKTRRTPIQNAEDEMSICSAADSRLTVYKSVDMAKPSEFQHPELLNLPEGSPKLELFKDASIAIFRLAPADYHRFHSPIDCEVGDMRMLMGISIPAVNYPGFDVFTANRRSILYLKHILTGQEVAFVAIGAFLLEAFSGREGRRKVRSTIVVCSLKASFDEDLVSNSQHPIETLLKVGYSIGRMPTN